MSSLEERLLQFTGSERWFKDPVTGILFTDGLVYFAEQGEANWALDEMALLARQYCRKLRNFIVFDLESKDNKATLIVSDGDYHAVAKKNYSHTDLEEGKYKFFAVYDGQYITILLPGEY